MTTAAHVLELDAVLAVAGMAAVVLGAALSLLAAILQLRWRTARPAQRSSGSIAARTNSSAR